jgi:hypothetical protein
MSAPTRRFRLRDGLSMIAVSQTLLDDQLQLTDSTGAGFVRTTMDLIAPRTAV